MTSMKEPQRVIHARGTWINSKHETAIAIGIASKAMLLARERQTCGERVRLYD